MENQKIKFIECKDEIFIFAEDIYKFKKIDANTTKIYIDTEEYECSLGLKELIDQIYGEGNSEFIPKPLSDGMSKIINK